MGPIYRNLESRQKMNKQTNQYATSCFHNNICGRLGGQSIPARTGGPGLWLTQLAADGVRELAHARPCRLRGTLACEICNEGVVGAETVRAAPDPAAAIRARGLLHRAAALSDEVRMAVGARKPVARACATVAHGAVDLAALLLRDDAPPVLALELRLHLLGGATCLTLLTNTASFVFCGTTCLVRLIRIC